MKKVLLILITLTAFMTGCDFNSKKESQKTMVCTRTVNQNNLKVDLVYNVDYKGDYVNTIHSVEKIESDNEETLKLYKDTVENVYIPYKNIEHYNYNVEIKDNVLVSEVTINYDKIDTDKMIEIDSANAQLIQDGKIKLSTVESMYSGMGIICEK